MTFYVRGVEQQEQASKAPQLLPLSSDYYLLTLPISPAIQSSRFSHLAGVASWVTFLLLLPNQSLKTLGQAAFFSCMVTVMLPANMPVSIWLFANFTLVLGAVVGWAWSCLGMKLALLARSQVLLARQVQTAQQNVASATNPGGCSW